MRNRIAMVIGTSNVRNHIDQVTQMILEKADMEVQFNVAFTLSQIEGALNGIEQQPAIIIFHSLGNNCRFTASSQFTDSRKMAMALDDAIGFCSLLQQKVLDLFPRIKVLVSLLLPRCDSQVR